MTEQDWLKALKEKDDQETHLAFADWLEEQGRRSAAAHQRQKAGVSTVRYLAVNKGTKEIISNEYGRIGDLKNHMIQSRRFAHYKTPTEFDILVREVRIDDVEVLTAEQLKTPLKG